MEKLSAGTLLVDRYRLIDQIGIGGMSVIWRAHDEVLERTVAIKVLSGELAADQRYRDLVREEARNAAKLVHRNITAVHDYGETVAPDGTVTAFVVMELLAGESLQRRLTAGPLPWTEAVEICAQVAEALAAAHRLGIVHRDITPSNIMLTSAGVKVLDFGIATRIGMPDLDDDGETFGTPAYVAPERLDGTPTLPATDTYAVGVLLYEALTGRVPYPALTWDDLARTPRDDTPPTPVGVAGLPAAVAQLCRECLARSPLDRPTAHQVAERLRASLPSGDGVKEQGECQLADQAAAQIGVPPPGHCPAGAADSLPARDQRGRRSRRLAAAIATAAVVLVGATALVATLVEPGDPKTPDAFGPIRSDPVSPEPTGKQSRTPPSRSAGTAAPPGKHPTNGLPGQSGGPNGMLGRGSGNTDPEASPDPAITIRETFGEIGQIIDAGVTAGEIDTDVATDLRNVLANLRYALDQGTTTLGEEVPKLREKVDTRKREGKISAASADLLNSRLDKLASL